MARSSNNARPLPAALLGPRLTILLVTLALVLFGLVMVYSSSMVKAITAGDDAYSFMIKQAAFAGVGVLVAFALWKLPTMSLLRLDPVVKGIWGITVALLLLTAVAGTGDESWGAKRWLYIGGFGLQPSEFAKITFVLVGAWLYSKVREGRIDSREALTTLIVGIIIPLLFLFRAQSDLGTTLIIAVGLISVLWLGEVPWQVIGVILLGCVGFVILATVFSSYRSGRWLFLNPWNDGENGLGSGYQLIRSYYAFSEGGIFGVGLGNSREKFLYLPMAETDFIYAIIGEELGMIGAVLVMLLFLVFLICGLRISQTASDGFGVMLAGGITIMLVTQAYLNMGCAVGVFPTTGKPLPFISSGGSSMISSLMMVGLILAVSEDASGPSIHEQRRQDLHVVHTTGGFDGFSAQRTNTRMPLGGAPTMKNNKRRR